MTKIGRLNVDLTANTRGFDVAMRNARSQLRDLRRAAAPGLGAMGMGGVGQMMGVMSMSGPFAAIGAATMAISSLAQQIAADRGRGAQNLSEILVQNMNVREQAQFSALSRAVTGEDSALPAREAMRAIQSMDWRQMSEAIGKGVERSTLESLKGISDPAEFFRQLQAAQAASPGLAAAVGGKAGEFISRMSVLDPARFDEMESITGGARTSRQVRMAIQQANRPLNDEEPGFLASHPRIAQTLEAVTELMRTGLSGGGVRDPELDRVGQRTFDRLQGDQAPMNLYDYQGRLLGTLDSIDRKIAGAAT
jgi:hypothetical protein